MSSTITALTSGGGLAMAGDTSGQLELKVNNGTTAITVDTSGNVGIGGTPRDVSGYVSLALNDTTGGLLDFYATSTRVGTISGNSSNMSLSTVTAVPMVFSVNTNEAMRIDTGGNVLIGTTSIGNTTSGNNVRFGQTGNGAMASVFQAALANGGTLDIDVGGGGAGSMCILEASNSNASNATIATRTIYAVMGRGTTFTFTSIGTQNGTSGGFGFSMSCPVGGRLRLTNTSGSTGDAVLTLFGTAAY